MRKSQFFVRILRREKASLGHMISAGSTYYVPSPNMGWRNAISNSLGEDKDRRLGSLWRETKIGGILPWEDVAEASERLLGISKANREVRPENNGDRK